MSVKTQINRLTAAKSAIATAIAGKGVTVPSSTKLDGMASLISSISGAAVCAVTIAYPGVFGMTAEVSYTSLDAAGSIVAIKESLSGVSEKTISCVVGSCLTVVSGAATTSVNVSATDLTLLTGFSTATHTSMVFKVTGAGRITLQQGSWFTNLLPLSTDTDGSVYGFKQGYRLSSSGGLSVASSSYITGFIPVSVGDTVYMKNVTYQYGVTSGLVSSNQRLSFYDANKQQILQTTATALGGVAGGVKGSDNIWTQFSAKATMSNTDCSGVAYFRLNASYIGSDSIITVNEPIE